MPNEVGTQKKIKVQKKMNEGFEIDPFVEDTQSVVDFINIFQEGFLCTDHKSAKRH